MRTPGVRAASVSRVLLAAGLFGGACQYDPTLPALDAPVISADIADASIYADGPIPTGEAGSLDTPTGVAPGPGGTGAPIGDVGPDPAEDAATAADTPPTCQTCHETWDGCCPAGCTSITDPDCPVVCGNGAEEAGETCDPLVTCPTSCPAVGCQLRKLASEGTCAARCVDNGEQMACASGDDCCPVGCNTTNDTDCKSVCDNGLVEAGESCEPVAECSRREAACQSDQNTIRTRRGSAAACTFRCEESRRPCGPSDGNCPAGCRRDTDCKPRPADCTEIQFCRNPYTPNKNQLICTTNSHRDCTDSERIAECAREAVTVCGRGHARPIIYRPPIGGRTSG